MKKINICFLSILLASYLCPVLTSAETMIVDNSDNINQNIATESSSIVSSDVNESINTSQYTTEETDNSVTGPEVFTEPIMENEEQNERSSKAILVSGIFGTSKWEIDSTGVLHIANGEFANTQNRSPWFQFKNQINKIIFDGPVKAASNSSHLFSDLNNVTEFINLSELDTSGVRFMRDMFANASSLAVLDLSSFDTSQVQEMGFMFSYTKSLVSLNVSSFNTSKVTSMRSLFYGTENLSSLDITNFDTSLVEDMSGMFSGSNVKSLDLSNFTTSSAIDMSGMFSGLDLNNLDLSGFDTTQVTNMSAMFRWSKLNNLDISIFNTSSVKEMDNMFNGSQIDNLDLSNFDIGQARNINNMFSASQISSLDLSSFNTSQVVYMYEMFDNMKQLKHIKLGELFQFKDEVKLPTPSVTAPYYGKWQRDHKGSVYTSDELAEQYDGSTMSGNYYWAEKLPTLEVKDSMIYVGEVWNPEDNFISATDEDGNILPFDPSMTDDVVNTNVPGSYEVTYTNKSISKTITVTVKENKQTLEVKDSIVYTGETWEAKDNFISATDIDGGLIEFDPSMTIDAVNPMVPGVYHVTYTNGSISKTITVTVKENKESIQAKDSFIYVGDNWMGQDNFVSARDKDGLSIPFNESMIAGVVNTQVPGSYPITYTYASSVKTIVVTVKENKESIHVKSSAIKVGDKWNPEDNFDGATDKAGGLVEFKDIKVTGVVDTSKVGEYEIIYSYGKISKKIIVFVEGINYEKNTEIDNHKDNVLGSGGINKKVQNTEKNKEQQVLPKTGEKDQAFLLLLGLFLSVTSIIVVKMRKNKI
ncbi:hypothetical protein DOK67_0002893 [Enterococcus sp. DIV0212c]|uniref:bacterial Ig-like domain-containing protein n=1 Tax=Enterococcus sp. DIV0212c TaxID=2230867 RepID=UPI001A9AE967|nr:bacterial Ig-like domain-containing protein [Enterococcus sp. DIV0212c]MBO1354380.1 BspA family leucine-rich repeat surface protein [Enterococcus sp. DIV0212c]